jgi:outer membrane immunogenic protein
MKRVLVTAVVVAASVSGSASAADLGLRTRPVYRAAPVAAFYNWTGCYVGANGGGFWARRDWSDPRFGRGDLGDETASGGLGGVQAGCNYQVAHWVFGLQGDWDWVSATDSSANLAFPLFTDRSDTKSLASVTGRIGYAWYRSLLYLKGGGAWLRNDFTLQTAGAVFSVSDTRDGWTVGVGGEYAFLDWLTGFIEYDHFGFRDDNGVSFGCGFACPIATVTAFPVNIRTDVDVVKAGINLKFGGYNRLY